MMKFRAMIRKPDWLFIAVILFILTGCGQEKSRELPAYGLIHRLIPEYEKYFIFNEIEDSNGKDVFELESCNGKILISGNNGVSMARGLNHYLNNYCHASVSRCGNQLKLPDPLPILNTSIRVISPYKYRYYLNYCTYSYSMAFWDWERWEQEIDWMAMNGINLPLAMKGQGAVWQNALRRLGFSEIEIFEFLPGPAYEAWWLMGNLEKWGGPVTQSYINKQADLQNKIVKRMREFGMEPVLQAFYGMAPNICLTKYPDADFRDPGNWCGYRRPAFLNPTDSLFEKFAKVFYEEQQKLYGYNKFFAGDPFHEGGQTADIDVKKASEIIYRIMNESNTGRPIWVLQAWQNNPRPELLNGLKKGQALVLDLWAETQPQWGGVESPWRREDGFLGHDWIWCTVPNFGGNVGLYGKLEIIANDIPKVLNHSLGTNISGIGTAMEGIETLPVIYDLTYYMGWINHYPEINNWIRNYAHYRYGQIDQHTEKAWIILANSVYNCPRGVLIEGCPESVLCARPAKNIRSVSTWGSTDVYYNTNDLMTAIEELIKVSEQFGQLDTYQYDLVDITRQLLTNRGQELYHAMIAAFEYKDKEAFEQLSSRFLQVILDQNELLSTRAEFLLGRWLEEARSLGSTPEEMDLFEWNARTQITTWGNLNAANDGGLHDYAHKEWSGMLKDFYSPRWEIFISQLRNQLEGKNVNSFDWYEWEEKWTKKRNVFSSKPSGDPVETAIYFFSKYAKTEH